MFIMLLPIVHTVSSCLKHDNVVRLYGMCIAKLQLVMEYVPCGDLHHLLRDEPLTIQRVPWLLRYRIALDVAKGMRYERWEQAINACVDVSCTLDGCSLGSDTCNRSLHPSFTVICGARMCLYVC